MQVFRSWYLFWFIVVGCGIVAVLAGIAIVHGPTNSSASPQSTVDKLTVAAFFAVLLGPILWALRCKVKVGDNGVTLIGYTNIRTFPWLRIVDASANWNGLHLALSDGSRATSAFVQKPIWDELLRRKSYADRVADLIASEASKRRLG